MPSREVDLDWPSFTQFFSKFAHTQALYRGHADAKWKLASTFFRQAPRSGLTLKRYIHSVLPDAYHQLSDQIDECDLEDPKQLCQFMSLLQHHGFPTPMLDWTYSPYMAAYFAFREINELEPQSDRIRVYILDALGWKKAFKQPLDVLQPAGFMTVLRPHARYNPRLIAQQGAFTLSNVPDLEDQIVAHQGDRSFIFSVCLSVKHKVQAMRELDLMGINEQSLFPGLDGTCRRLQKLYFTAPEVGPTPTEKIGEMLESLKRFTKETG